MVPVAGREYLGIHKVETVGVYFHSVVLYHVVLVHNTKGDIYRNHVIKAVTSDSKLKFIIKDF